MDPDSRQTGKAETAAPPTVTPKDVNDKWRPFSGKVNVLVLRPGRCRRNAVNSNYSYTEDKYDQRACPSRSKDVKTTLRLVYV